MSEAAVKRPTMSCANALGFALRRAARTLQAEDTTPEVGYLDGNAPKAGLALQLLILLWVVFAQSSAR